MRVGHEEGPLVATADARRLVHLIVVLDHLAGRCGGLGGIASRMKEPEG